MRYRKYISIPDIPKALPQNKRLHRTLEIQLHLLKALQKICQIPLKLFSFSPYRSLLTITLSDSIFPFAAELSLQNRSSIETIHNGSGEMRVKSSGKTFARNSSDIQAQQQQDIQVH